MVTEPRTVHQRICDAYRIIASHDFTKSGKVGIGKSGYAYIPISAILAAVRKAHAEAGLFVTFGELEYNESNGEYRGQITKTKENPVTGKQEPSKWEVAIGFCEATIHGADGDTISTIVPFEASSVGDKCGNLLVSNIERNLYRCLYAIDGEDDEEEVAPAPVQKKEDKFFSPKKEASQ